MAFPGADGSRRIDHTQGLGRLAVTSRNSDRRREDQEICRFLHGTSRTGGSYQFLPAVCRIRERARAVLSIAFPEGIDRRVALSEVRFISFSSPTHWNSPATVDCPGRT